MNGKMTNMLLERIFESNEVMGLIQRNFTNAFTILKHKCTCMGSGKVIHCYLRKELNFLVFSLKH